MAVSVYYVQAHSYLHYRMYRLIAINLQRNLNRSIIGLTACLLIMYILFAIRVNWLKLFRKQVLAVMISVLMLLLVDYLLKKFTHHSLLTAVGKFISRIGELLSGEITWAFFMYIVKIRLRILIIAVPFLIAIPFLFRWLVRIKWGKIMEKISAGVTARYWKKGALILLLPFLFLNGGLWLDSKINAPAGPNLIILLIDALRKDHMGVYGYHRQTTPNIDRFSREVTVLPEVISQSSWTNPSVASLFSLLYPSVHGLNSYSESRASALDRKIVTLAEILKEKGYATGAFVANHWVCRRLQYDQGFDTFDRINLDYKPRASEVNKKALAWIGRNKDRPFFAYVHYMDVHGPYNPPEAYASFFQSTGTRPMTKKEARRLAYLSVGRKKDNNDLNYYIDRYDGEIRYIDDQIERFLKKLTQNELMDNSIIIITSDHGEAFFEHGFCDHGSSLYNEEIVIPFIIQLPPPLQFPDLKMHRTELIDVIALLLELLGYSLPYEADGGGEAISSGAVFSQEISGEQRGIPKMTIIKDDFKAIYPVEKMGVTELYNLKEDYSEQNNLIDVYPRKSEELEEELESWQKDKLRKRATLGIEEFTVGIEDDKTLEQLKALGYIQ